MTVDTLKDCNKKVLAQMAKDQGIAGWHAMRKDQLIRALSLPPTASKKAIEKAKIPIATLSDRVRYCVQASFAGRRVVIFSGGPAAPDNEIFDEVRAIREAGGFDSIMGGTRSNGQSLRC